jgi:hypothetical protein
VRALDDQSTMEPPYLKPGTLIANPRRRKHEDYFVTDPEYWTEDFPDPHWEEAGRYGREGFSLRFLGNAFA